jgi:hypothetical protein
VILPLAAAAPDPIRAADGPGSDDRLSAALPYHPLGRRAWLDDAPIPPLKLLNEDHSCSRKS